MILNNNNISVLLCPTLAEMTFYYLDSKIIPDDSQLKILFIADI